MMKAYRDPTEKELARMKVCILMGSPRKQGNTNALLVPFRQELEALGAETGLSEGLDGIRLRPAGRCARHL